MNVWKTSASSGEEEQEASGEEEQEATVTVMNRQEHWTESESPTRDPPCFKRYDVTCR